MREVLLLTLTILGTRTGSSFSAVAAAPVAVAANQICHVFQYTGQACSSLSSGSKSSCATSSFCALPLTSCTSGGSNSTGCIATPQGTVACNGSIQSTGTNGTSFQCICNNESRSCPSNGTPLSISFSNGSYSTQNIPASQSGNFSFTWTADTSTSTSNISATATISVPAPTAMTTFFGTFSLDDGATRSSIAGNGSSVRGQAAHAGNGGGAPEQAASTSAASQGQQQQQQTGSASTASLPGTVTMMVSLAFGAGLMLTVP